MIPDDQPPLQSQPPTSALASPNPVPSLPQKTMQHPKRKMLIISSIALLCVGFGAILFTISTASSCLSTSDFTKLAGYAPAEPFTPTDNFYTDYITFAGDSFSDYDPSDNGAHGNQLIQQIATFYKSASNKPMTITITGDFSSKNNEWLANKRVSTVRSDLLANGIPSEKIATEPVTSIEAESETSETGETALGATYIIITANASCK